jgi:hypothetical protein
VNFRLCRDGGKRKYARANEKMPVPNKKRRNAKMKKLFALLLGIAIIFSLSAVGFAEAADLVNLAPGIEAGEETAATDDNGSQSISTTYDAETNEFVTTATGIEGQATILVYDGTRLQTTSGDLTEITDGIIEYIDQETAGDTTTFTYKLKENPTDGAKYTIAVGGSNVDTVLYQEVVPSEDDSDADIGSIEGTVNFAGYYPNDPSLSKATLTLTNTVIDEPIVSYAGNGNFSITEVPVGSYTLTVTKKNHTYVIVEGIAVTVGGTATIPGTLELYAGDIVADGNTNIHDGKVNSSDYGEFVTQYKKNYEAYNLDDDPESYIGSSDYGVFVQGYKKSWATINLSE